jgi:hypothetical protein
VGANAATNRHDFLVALEAAEKIKREEDEQAASEADDGKPKFDQVASSLR